MPIYEYLCNGCKKRVSLLVRSISNPGTPECPRCGGTDLERLMSRFARVRSEDDRLDGLADDVEGLGGMDEDDPRAAARMLRKMKDEMGEDAGEDFDEAVDALESGELGDEDGDGGAGDGGDDDL
jgi:putative FmdB family regulatory protein